MSSHLGSVSNALSEKLGMYFYVNQAVTWDVRNTQLVQLMTELEDANIYAEYLSQSDATTALQRRLPDIVEQFQDYGIEIDLPSTLYITIKNEQQHNQLISILPKYSEIITNLDDLGDASSVRSQEQRIMKAIDFSTFLQGMSVLLIAVFGVVMVAAIVLLLYFKLEEFDDVFALQKILWASYNQMRNPFIVFSGLVLLGGFVVSFVLTLLVALMNTWKTQSFVYFAQLLWLENLKTGIWGLLFGGYGLVLLMVLGIALVSRVLISLMIDRRVKHLS